MFLRVSVVFTLAVLTSGCILPDEVTPRVGTTLAVASQYNHRGMVQNEYAVAQGKLRVSVPTKDGGNLRLETFGNVDLRNSTGDAWFPNGHGGKFSEVDLMAAYGRRIGALSAMAGIVGYILPDGTQFPNGERGTTTELFLNVAGEVLGVTTEVELHYDADEVEGLYAKVGARKSFQPFERVGVEVRGHVGYSDEEQSLWNYGLKEAGFADVRAAAEVHYQFDARTRIYTSLSGSTIIDDDLRDWFDLIGIDDDNIWVEFGVDWNF